MDAIRVGNDYWMVSTTNHFSPGAPIIHSTDHFTGNRFAIFNYSTATAGGYVDLDWFHFRKL